MRVGIVVSIAVALVLAGCAPQAGSDANESGEPSARTCGEYLELSAVDQQTVARDLLAIDSAMTFSATGVESSTSGSLVARLCADESKTATLLSLRAAILAVSEVEPTCEEFLALDAAVRQEWAEAIVQDRFGTWDEGGVKSQWGETLGISCESLAGTEAILTEGARNLSRLRALDPEAYLALVGSVVPPDATYGGASFSMHAVDMEGYEFQIDVEMQPLRAVVDTANAPPGKALVEITGSGTATITSQNVGKNAPTFNVIVRTGIAAFWSGQTGLCSDAIRPREVTSSMDKVSGGYRVHGPDGCTVNFGLPMSAGDAILKNGESVSVGLNISGGRFETSAESASAIVAAIASQTQTWLGSSSTPQVDGECTQGAIGDISVIWASRPVDGCVIPNIG